MSRFTFFNRELSWLSFNYRVLQEAKDLSVPLYDRIKFLAIFSSNLDEFFRVRVGSLRAVMRKDLGKKKQGMDTSELLLKIKRRVNRYQEEFGEIYRKQIIPSLNRNNIFILDENNLSPAQIDYILTELSGEILPEITPSIFEPGKINLFLKNKTLYHFVELVSRDEKQTLSYSIFEIPVEKFGRFINISVADGKHCYIFLDDLIRVLIPLVFEGFVIRGVYSVKLTRDAELDIGDEFSGSLLEKIKKGLKKRKSGVTSRFLFDKRLSKYSLKILKKGIGLAKEDMIPGGRYHNFSDFFGFPNPLYPLLELPPMSQIKSGITNYFKVMKCENRLFYYPYHDYSVVTDFLNQAASDPAVRCIKITFYRVASNSKIVEALCNASKNGKEVTVFVELKARFDEESNIDVSGELKEAGVVVHYSIPGIKVHSKICLVERVVDGRVEHFGYLATGNFNEKTAKIYTDFGYFTSDPAITSDMVKVFNYLLNFAPIQKLNKLIVPSVNFIEWFYGNIDREIKAANEGKKGIIIIKVNNLEEKSVIEKLYQASNAGVKIYLIVRAICCLISGVKDQSENIKVFSIVGKFLEHPRVFYFHNGGDAGIWLGSADLMGRNIYRRIEVVFPVEDATSRATIMQILKSQLKDNLKSRVINKSQNNPYRKSKSTKPHNSQEEILNLLKQI